MVGKFALYYNTEVVLVTENKGTFAYNRTLNRLESLSFLTDEPVDFSGIEDSVLVGFLARFSEMTETGDALQYGLGLLEFVGSRNGQP